MRHLTPIAIVLVIVLLPACSGSTSPAKPCQFASADAIVNTTSSNTFDPKAATIAHGNKVCWQNTSSVLHTVTADGGAFDTNLPVGQIFIFTFSTAGTYTYHCKIHSGMTGTITVN